MMSFSAFTIILFHLSNLGSPIMDLTIFLIHSSTWHSSTNLTDHRHRSTWHYRVIIHMAYYMHRSALYRHFGELTALIRRRTRHCSTTNLTAYLSYRSSRHLPDINIKGFFSILFLGL
jgi:hypothetical protein